MNPHTLDIDRSAPLYAFSSVVSERTAAHQLAESVYRFGESSRQADYARTFLTVCESVPQTHLVGSLDAEYMRKKHGES